MLHDSTYVSSRTGDGDGDQTVVVCGCVQGIDCKRVRGNFLVEMSYILIGVIVTWVRTFVKIHQMVH